MIRDLRPLAAEFIGTMLFVFLGAASVVTFAAPGPSASAVAAVGIALAHGVALAIIVSMTMNISGGHINPAVTIGLWIADRVDGKVAGRYIVAQLLGALSGAALMKGILPSAGVTLALAGTPRLAGNVTFLEGIWIEAVLTFFLVSAVFGTAVSPEAPKMGGWGIGLAVFVGALVGGSLTGGAMNPARAFGPAVISWNFSGHAVYWAGPLLGAALAGVVWKTLLLPRS